MKNREIIGIDVSKNTLDVYVLSAAFHFKVENSPKGFVTLVETSLSKLNADGEAFYCFENTGRYSRQLSVFLAESGYTFALLNALDLKRSLGLVRGKSDKKDARMIAIYAKRKGDELQSTILPGPVIDQLKHLLWLREKLIKHRTAYKNTNQDLHDCYIDDEFDYIRKTHQRMLDHLTMEVEKVEAEILRLIKNNTSFYKNYQLMLSVRGVGKIMAFYILIYTENFTRFTDPRKFACFAGIAPFEYTSGTSVKGRSKVHNCANKQLKSLLNLSAMSSIRYAGEYRTYYLRRVEEGKNKMSTLNILRNKILFRIFAVVKRGTPYVDLTKFAA